MVNFIYKLFGNRQCSHCGSYKTCRTFWTESYNFKLGKSILTNEGWKCLVCNERTLARITKVDDTIKSNSRHSISAAPAPPPLRIMREGERPRDKKN
jgi:hypothetical protein